MALKDNTKLFCNVKELFKLLEGILKVEVRLEMLFLAYKLNPTQY